MLAALADGVTRISHYAPGNDCQSTLKCLEQLGTIVSRHASFDRDTGAEVPTVQIVGRGLRGLQSSRADLDCGNSGSTLRMLAGVLAAHPFTSVLTGDVSLRRRPMLRISLRPMTWKHCDSGLKTAQGGAATGRSSHQRGPTFRRSTMRSGRRVRSTHSSYRA